MADSTLQSRMKPIFAALASQSREFSPRSLPVQHGQPFVTVSRDAGAGGGALADALVVRLNESRKPNQPLWQCFDRTLVEQVAQNHHIAAQLVNALEDRAHNWLTDMLEGMHFHARVEPSDQAIYRRVAETILAIARAGNAVIVGRGASLVTRDMPGGVHVRLVAPLAVRIDRFASDHDLKLHEAEQRIRRIDDNRRSFHQRFWGINQLSSDMFTVTFNTAELTMPQIVAALSPWLTSASAQPVRAIS